MTAAKPTTPHNPYNELTITIDGLPAPQGSKKGFPVRRPNGTIGVALTESAGHRVSAWRQDVRAAASATMTATGWQPPTRGMPVAIELEFYLPRPKAHYRTGRNATRLRASAPALPATKPDLDKLVRATLDALTSAGVYPDDSAVCRIETEKLYAPPGTNPGATITVRFRREAAA